MSRIFISLKSHDMVSKLSVNVDVYFQGVLFVTHRRPRANVPAPSTVSTGSWPRSGLTPACAQMPGITF